MTFQGQVGPEVARLVFVPVAGTNDVPLLPQGPGSGPLLSQRVRPGLTAPIPIEDRRLPGARGFAIAATYTNHALLLAYGRDGRLIADGGKLW
ncbi:hypothetical protein [Embleya sp. NPDC005575]|uniref:hypothetical protein n=1 Tax=Embleya sp. NPDC005575 TaxID=3156892 RepID=UPI0033B32DDC